MVSGPARATDPLSGAASAARPIASHEPGQPIGPTTTADSSFAGTALRDPRNDKAQQTGSLRIPIRRRRLRGIVFATLAMCTLILVAAVVSRVGHASNEAAALPSFTTNIPSTATPGAPAVAAPAAPRSAAPAATEPTTGTLRIERPAAPGRVWLDGKKVTAASSVVSCGTHQLKNGLRARSHAVQIPCGGEFVVSR
jgi:hypothetical protein